MKSSRDIQTKVFINTFNSILGDVKISSLDELKDGNKLPLLINKLYNKKLSSKVLNIFQKSANNQSAMTILQTKNDIFKSINIDNNSFIFAKHFIEKCIICTDQNTLRNSVSLVLDDYKSIIPIKDMDKSFQKGLPFIALLTKISNGTIEFIDKGDPILNYYYIKESCDSLGIPFVLIDVCIIDKPDALCNLIQSSLFLKHINTNEISEKLDDQKKQDNFTKMDTLISKYNELYKNADENIIHELNNINMSIKNPCLNEAQKRTILITDFFKSSKAKIDESLNKAKSSFDVMNSFIKRNQMELPHDMIKIDFLQKKYDELLNIYQYQRKIISKEIEDMKILEQEVRNIYSLDEAKKVFDKLKAKYGFDDWKSFPHTSLIFIAGCKVESHEKIIENKKEIAKKEYETKLKKFKDSLFSIFLEFERKKNDENESFYMIKYDLEKLEQKIPSVKYSFDQMKEFNEESFFPNLQYQVDSIKNDMNDIFKTREWKQKQKIYESTLKSFKSSFDYALSKLENKTEDESFYFIDYLVEKLVENLNSVKKAFDEMKKCKNDDTTFPELDEQIKTLKSKIEDDKKAEDILKMNKNMTRIINECNSISEKIKKIISENMYSGYICQELDKIDFPKKIQNQCAYPGFYEYSIDYVNELISKTQEEWGKVYQDFKKINDFSLNIRGKFPEITFDNLEDSLTRLKEAQDQLKNAENENDLNERTNEYLIKVYNNELNHANEMIDQSFVKIIEIFNNFLDEMKIKVKNNLKETDSIEKDHQEYISTVESFNCYIKRMPIYHIIDEKLNLHRNKDLDEIENEMKKANELIQLKIDSIPNRLVGHMNIQILEYEKEKDRQIEELKKMSLEADKLSISLIEQKASEALSKKIEINEFILWLNNYTKKYKYNIKIADTTTLEREYLNIYIFYKSTLLLNPLLCLEHLEERLKECKEPSVSLACIILIIKNRPMKNEFNISNEDFEDFEFQIKYNVTKDEYIFFDIVKQLSHILLKCYMDIYNSIIAEILIEAINFYSDIQIHLDELIYDIIGGRKNIKNIKKTLEKNSYLTSNNALISFISWLNTTVDYIEKLYMGGDPALFIDFGSRYIRVLDDGKVKEHLNNEKKKITIKLFEILEIYRKKLSKNCLVVVCFHYFDRTTNEVAKSVIFDFDENLKLNPIIVNPSVGIILNTDKDSGIVVDLGHEFFTITPVFKGQIIDNCRMIRTKECGKHIYEEFCELTKIHIRNFTSNMKYMIDFDEEFYKYAGYNMRVQASEDEPFDYEIKMKGNSFRNKNAAYLAEKYLFNGYFNLSDKIISIARKASNETEQKIDCFLSNIVLAGGLANAKGLNKRLKNDISKHHNSVNIVLGDSISAPIKGAYKMSFLPSFYRKYYL